MIIDMEEGRKLYPTLSDQEIKDILIALETSIRQLTNNKFHNSGISHEGSYLFEDDKIVGNFERSYLEVGDRIEVAYTKIHDGLYNIVDITDNYIQVDKVLRTDDNKRYAYIVLIEYPADIKNGVIGMIKYDKKMEGKEGIKSETVARYTVQYFDIGSSENISGYPSAVISFIKKYRKLRW